MANIATRRGARTGGQQRPRAGTLPGSAARPAPGHGGELAEEMAHMLVQVGAAPSPEAALEALLRGAMVLLRGDAGVGRFFDAQTGECSLLLRLRPDGVMDRVRERHHLDAGTVGAALQAGGTATIVEDFQAFDAGRYAYFEVMRDQGLRSAVNVPIDAGGRRIGSLHINHRRPGFFGPTDLAVAAALAAQAGAVIERARLVEAERVQWQARLESEERLQLVGRATNDAVWDWDLLSNALWWNAGIQTLFGYRPEQVVPSVDFWAGNLHPDDAARVLRDVHAVIDDGSELWSGEYRFRRADGSFATVLDRGYVLRDAAGRPTRMVCAMLDITARKAAEEALAQRYQEAEESRSRARAIFDATDEAMLLVAPNGSILSVNWRFRALFDLGEQELAGLDAADTATHFARIFCHPGDAERLVAHLAGRNLETSWDMRQSWPAERDLTLSCRPVTTATGTTLGRLFAFRDVTRERALIRLKDEFVAHVSHELRTPLTSIKGYADLLMAGEVGDVSAEQAEFLGIIKRNADREVALVNDLLDLSRIEAGKVELTLASVDLRSLISGIGASFRLQVQAKRQVFTVDLPGALPAVWGDANRLAQVFTNLLSNAHKYTPPEGRIAVTATANAGNVRVTVTDSGIGMTEHEQRQLFSKFFRAKNHTATEVGGTGLGLAITKSLVELHGGAITVQSGVDSGSSFTVELPVQHGAAAGAATEGGNGPSSHHHQFARQAGLLTVIE